MYVHVHIFKIYNSHLYACISFLFQLDSSAFFPYLAYGANNEMAGIVTLLSIAKLLGDMKRNVSHLPNHVLTLNHPSSFPLSLSLLIL